MSYLGSLSILGNTNMAKTNSSVRCFSYSVSVLKDSILYLLLFVILFIDYPQISLLNE
jgi:hypothetical protein